MSGSMCEHPRCQENGHCILEALWLNPPEFANERPIEIASQLQETFWEKRREWDEYRNAVALLLWVLVDRGGGAG
jgi:hypothetical protein